MTEKRSRLMIVAWVIMLFAVAAFVSKVLLVLFSFSLLPQTAPDCRRVWLPADATKRQADAAQLAVAVWNDAGRRHFNRPLFKLLTAGPTGIDESDAKPEDISLTFDRYSLIVEDDIETIGRCVSVDDKRTFIVIFSGAERSDELLAHVLTHELGHAIGIASHHDDVTGLMYPTATFVQDVPQLAASDRMLLCRRYVCVRP